MRTRDHEEIAPLVNLADITEIELVILKRMREVTIGDHRSRSHGSGFDFIGLRDWQAGDRFSSIDWAQSSLTNFSPLIVREFEQPSTATVIADRRSRRRRRAAASAACRSPRPSPGRSRRSACRRCSFRIRSAWSPSTAASSTSPRSGRAPARATSSTASTPISIERNLQQVRRSGTISTSLGGFVRRQAMLPVISDFLFDDADAVVQELALLNATHDVFLVLIDSAFAFELPDVSAGWIEIVDVETGTARTISRRAYRDLAARANDGRTM